MEYDYDLSRKKPSVDHLGNYFDSIKSMCKHWNVPYEAYTRRVKIRGWSVEKALTSPVKHNGGIYCTDHNGKKYKSITKMCKRYNISRKQYCYRISHGWTQEEALTTLPGERRHNNG